MVRSINDGSVDGPTHICHERKLYYMHISVCDLRYVECVLAAGLSRDGNIG
jgi:hypothetical protein